MKPHPLSLVFPDLTLDQYTSLKESIKEHGLLEPITSHEGMILDGRHRFKACTELEIKPRIEELPSGVSPNDFVVAKNANRRHLKDSQRAACAGEFYEKTKRNPVDLLKAANEKRRLKILKPTERTENGRDPNNRYTYKVAAMFSISVASLNLCKIMYVKGKDLFEKVKNGECTIQWAYFQYRERNGIQRRSHEEYNEKSEGSVFRIMESKNDLVVPDCFASLAETNTFIRQMCAKGWVLEMKVKADRGGMKYYANWYGNGFISRKTNWLDADSEPSLVRAVVVSAKNKLNKPQPKAA